MSETDHFEKLIRPLFREDANFRQINRNTENLIFRIDWKIPEVGRPNKRSRPIELVLTREFREDYADASRDEDRAYMDSRIVRCVEMSLDRFSPEHNLPREQPVPAEEWLIKPDLA